MNLFRQLFLFGSIDSTLKNIDLNEKKIKKCENNPANNGDHKYKLIYLNQTEKLKKCINIRGISPSLYFFEVIYLKDDENL